MIVTLRLPLFMAVLPAIVLLDVTSICTVGKVRRFIPLNESEFVEVTDIASAVVELATV
jgi:hypothetical protein